MPFYYVSASDGTNVVKVSIHYTMQVTLHNLITSLFDLMLHGPSQQLFSHVQTFSLVESILSNEYRVFS